MTASEGRRLVAIACLYASYGIDLGLLGSGAPLVLRAHGVPLAAIGLVQLIYLPIGLGFLWAPLLDRWRGPLLPHRTGWIAAAQVATALLLAGLAAVATHAPVAGLVALALAVSVALTTTDLSLDALVAQTGDSAGRASAATAKLVGSSLGTAIGIALATVFADRLPLPGAALAAAIATLLLTLPILGFGEASGPSTRVGAAVSRRSALDRRGDRVMHRRRLAGRAARLGVFFAASLALGTAPGLLLIDLHVPLTTTGLITGPLGIGLGTATTLLSGIVLARTRIDAARLLVLFAAGVVAAGLLLLLAAFGGWGRLAAAASLIGAVSSSGLGVPIFATLYRWAEGDRAATDYAVLFGAAFLVSFPARLATPALAALLGWPGFFALVTPLFAASVAFLAAGMATPVDGMLPRRGPARAATARGASPAA